jgi:hypothetical protein
METLKKLFPYSFKEKNDVAALVLNIIAFIVAGFVIGVIISLLARIPFIGILVSILGGAIDLYITISIVLSILDYLKILK